MAGVHRLYLEFPENAGAAAGIYLYQGMHLFMAPAEEQSTINIPGTCYTLLYSINQGSVHQPINHHHQTTGGRF